MQLSAPCRIVEMTAEVLGLEYEFKVRQTIQLLKMIIKVFNLIFI